MSSSNVAGWQGVSGVYSTTVGVRQVVGYQTPWTVSPQQINYQLVNNIMNSGVVGTSFSTSYWSQTANGILSLGFDPGNSNWNANDLTIHEFGVYQGWLSPTELRTVRAAPHTQTWGACPVCRSIDVWWQSGSPEGPLDRSNIFFPGSSTFGVLGKPLLGHK